MSDSICDEDLENIVVNDCKESGIDVDARDIEACHDSQSQGIVRVTTKG